MGVGNLPEKVRQATESYRAEMDPLDWLEDSCVVIDNIWTPAKSLWSNYMEWSKENHLRYPLGRKTFSQRLNERFPELRRGKNRDRGFVGLGVKRALADTSEVSATPDDPVDSQISFFMEENLEVSVRKCPPRYKIATRTKCPPRRCLGFDQKPLHICPIQHLVPILFDQRNRQFSAEYWMRCFSRLPESVPFFRRPFQLR